MYKDRNSEARNENYRRSYEESKETLIITVWLTLVHEPANMWKHRQKWSKLVTLCK